MATATVRKGISGRLTLEARGKILQGQQTLGLGGGIFNSLGVTTGVLALIPGFPNLAVSSNNRVMARTNAAGDALISDLASYRNNIISIDTLALPMDSQLVSNQAVFVPYYRSGLAATFSIKRSRSAVLTLMLEDGKPAPVGMNVTLQGGAEAFMVGLRGEVFITDLGDSTQQIRAEWRGKICQFDCRVPADARATVYADPMVCKGVTR
jgi:outer membrane usher protein